MRRSFHEPAFASPRAPDSLEKRYEETVENYENLMGQVVDQMQQLEVLLDDKEQQLLFTSQAKEKLNEELERRNCEIEALLGKLDAKEEELANIKRRFSSELDLVQRLERIDRERLDHELHHLRRALTTQQVEVEELRTQKLALEYQLKRLSGKVKLNKNLYDDLLASCSAKRETNLNYLISVEKPRGKENRCCCQQKQNSQQHEQQQLKFPRKSGRPLKAKLSDSSEARQLLRSRRILFDSSEQKRASQSINNNNKNPHYNNMNNVSNESNKNALGPMDLDEELFQGSPHHRVQINFEDFCDTPNDRNASPLISHKTVEVSTANNLKSSKSRSSKRQMAYNESPVRESIIIEDKHREYLNTRDTDRSRSGRLHTRRGKPVSGFRASGPKQATYETFLLQRSSRRQTRCLTSLCDLIKGLGNHFCWFLGCGREQDNMRTQKKGR